MIAVFLGTHGDPFDRLVSALEEWALIHGEAVVIQSGSTSMTQVCDGQPWMTPRRIATLMNDARVVICHAGPATIFEAWDAGHKPVVVPRNPEFGEHVDDHQQRFAARLGKKATVIDTPLLLPALTRCLEIGTTTKSSDLVTSSMNTAFLEGFDELVETLMRNGDSASHVGDRGVDSVGVVWGWIRATVRRQDDRQVPRGGQERRPDRSKRVNPR